ncbi:uncharacterized protein MAM_04576 [Metarhizium album ARSEF 1941]|uniref:Heat shock protein Hsp70 n=1 Tax=Metarhizium album (strain ARSEF 1941) TaxID=1081103 RepID=A0A0B2WNC4_METAS|nr:uncharacterized protein MAM_04576 [Metarhizium album ARSEF 1941]KHN97561.1 hypothetical protein MAM_04576 [Metarhizium album ARSEF 1941]
MPCHENGGSCRPDLYVGVDFGTTFTGVSYMTPGDAAATIIRTWPGKKGAKVPSVLAKDTTGNNIKWGFLCHDLDESSKWRFLKLCLDCDPSRLADTPWAPADSSEAYKLVEVYLRQIYLYLSGHLVEKLMEDRTNGVGSWNKSWAHMRVEFTFSVPGTWSPLAVHRFARAARRAGFGQEIDHQMGLGLTESVAAVVATSELNIPFANGDAVLSIDAGGGTTDLAFVTLQSMKPMMMEPVLPVTAIGVGSVLIDMGFKNDLETRLAAKGVPLDTARKCAAKISQGEEFQRWKCNHGQENTAPDKSMAGTIFNSEALDNQGVPADYNLIFEKKLLDGLFDCQIKEIKAHVIAALGEFEKARGKRLKHIVLSGGLGSSDYVFQKLDEFFTWQKGRRPCLGEAKLWTCSNPQTAVIRGLLMNKRNETFGPRITRASYGVVAHQCPLGKSKSRLKGSRDSRGKAVPGQIQWVVKKGTMIRPNDRFRHKVTRTFTKSDPDDWTETIVSSTCSLEYLPQTTQDAGVEVLCQVQVPKGAPTGMKKGTWPFAGRYQTYECELQIVVGDSGECTVDVISSRGVELSKGSTTINVSHNP